MDKVELGQKWSKYCDIDKLVDDVCAKYKGNHHTYSIHGICTMLDEFFTQKEPLIQLFQTSNHYIGNLRIAFQSDFERQISASEVSNFFNGIHDKLNSQQILQKKDANGKTFDYYLNTGKKSFDINNLPNQDEQNAKFKSFEGFDRYTLYTSDSQSKLTQFKAYMQSFKKIAASKLPCDLHYSGDDTTPALKRGTKTSRAFNTVCTHYGVDKFNPSVLESTDENGNVTKRTVYPYNKVFAAYADLVSDITRKMYFVISLNPLDYLTMSNGVSWKSCHNIYDGCYKGGTLSYMLDKTSMVTFVVSDLADPIHESPKFYRQMYHYDNGMFVQNRLYPQGNDGATDLYEKFRNLVIEEFSELIEAGEEWDVDKGNEACIEHTESLGAHYKDYRSNSSCTVFYPHANKANVRDYVMTIGHNGICAKCGRPFTSTNRLSHDRYDPDCTVE